jgi:sec-independent protein translocase protein TatB
MLDISWVHLLILFVVGVLVLGPERLPGAIRWTADALRKARDYLAGATTQLRDEFGPEFDDLREPLGELQRLRRMSPRAALTKHLLDGDDSLFTWLDPNAGPTAPPKTPAAQPDQSAPSVQPSENGGRPAPFDNDAT